MHCAGTHLLQNITITPTSNGSEILISADFINTSDTAIGFMAIAYTRPEARNLYWIANRPLGELHAQVTLSYFLEDQYRISIFSLQDNGLPFTRSAAKPWTVSNITGKIYSNIIIHIMQ